MRAAFILEEFGKVTEDKAQSVRNQVRCLAHSTSIGA
jgi:hypothetical protein